MALIEFNEEKHEYSIDGVVYPSVTEICEPISFAKLDAVQKIVVERARLRGSAVHEWISEYIYTGDLSSLDDLDDDCVAYAEAFVNWWRTYKPTALYSEFVLGDAKLGYCGTCDFVCELDGKIALIDFKTTATVNKKYLSVQLEGYRRLLASAGVTAETFWVLHLKKDGTYSFREIALDGEWFDLLLTHNRKMREK